MVTDYKLEKDAIENSIEMVRQLRDRGAYTDEIVWELNSIEKFYKIKLQSLKNRTADAS
jgi:hypothetical protein